MQGLIYQRGQSKPFVVELIIESDILTYQNHRHTKGYFKDDYTIIGYTPQKYDIFLPQAGFSSGMVFNYYSETNLTNAPLIIESVNGSEYTFKQIFDIDVPVIMSGTNTFKTMLLNALSVAVNTIFQGIFYTFPSVIGSADVLNNTYTYSQVSNTTIANVWQTINTNSTNPLAVTLTFKFDTGLWYLSVDINDLTRNNIALSIGSSQILEVTTDTNFNASSGVNVVGGYLEDGTIYKYCYLNSNGNVALSSDIPYSIAGAPIVVKYTQIETADDSTLISSSIQSLTRNLINSPVTMSMKLSLYDQIIYSLDLGSYIQIIDYKDSIQQMALREYDFIHQYIICGDNTTLTMVS